MSVVSFSVILLARIGICRIKGKILLGKLDRKILIKGEITYFLKLAQKVHVIVSGINGIWTT